jgi:hypothetical protein
MRLPHMSEYMYGEPLPVLDVSSDDPASLGYAYEQLAALIANGLEDVELLVEDRPALIRSVIIKRSFHWDVFLSHSSVDKPRVARLAERLERAGLRVWFDLQSIDGGQDIVAAIEDGLESSRVLVLCMTRAAFESEWARLERNTATFRDPLNHERRFLPLRFDDCVIPAALRRLKYIDYRDESDRAWQELLACLQPGAEPLPELPPEEWNPFDPYTPALGSGFVGRAEELRRLQQAMEMGHSVSVVGDWRIGKTSLLAAFAERARAAGRVVRHLSGEGPEGASLAAFVTEVTGRPASAEPDEAADQLSEWADAHHHGGLRPLLIVDEVERPMVTFEHRFFERLRGMLQRLMVVLCSRRELDQVYQEQRRTSPFSNTLELVRLALLDANAIEEILGWGHGLLTSDDLSTVREWAGRHPYYVQLLARELVKTRQNDLSTENAMDRFYDISALRLREIWNVLSQRDRHDLLKSASGIPSTRRTLRLRGLTTDDGMPFGRILSEWILETAESVSKQIHPKIVTLAPDPLPNVFRAGCPLQPDLGQETFRGRDDVVRQIEVLLNDDRQWAAVALLAPRRCGKSSLLRMLPVMLPDTLCVFFDLQDNPLSTPLDLFPALARRTVEQAREQHRGSLPELTGNTLEAARQWLDALEQRPGEERVLFCFDEFERLEELVAEKPETKQQLVQLMGLLRATIQHRRRVRLLVAGTATFEELGPLWTDTFTSAQEFQLGPLERDVAVDLLRQPIPASEGFPEDAVPAVVAEAIVDRTGGQPYLTQLYGFWLVEELNRQKRRRAEPADVETVDEIVCDKAGPFFRECLEPRGARFEVRPVIEQIVDGQTPELTGAQTRFLVRRGLITADIELAFPILARWLNEFAE